MLCFAQTLFDFVFRSKFKLYVQRLYTTTLISKKNHLFLKLFCVLMASSVFIESKYL